MYFYEIHKSVLIFYSSAVIQYIKERCVLTQKYAYPAWCRVSVSIGKPNLCGTVIIIICQVRGMRIPPVYLGVPLRITPWLAFSWYKTVNVWFIEWYRRRSITAGHSFTLQNYCFFATKDSILWRNMWKNCHNKSIPAPRQTGNIVPYTRIIYRYVRPATCSFWKRTISSSVRCCTSR